LPVHALNLNCLNFLFFIFLIALPGDGSTPIVEIIESDDDGGGPSEKLAGDIYRGRRNDEKGNKELKRKRGLFLI